MSLYTRGDVWWYKFWFNGQLIRESSKSESKTLGKDADRARRRELEQAYNRIPKRERMPLFSHAAELWLASKAGLAEKSRERYEQCVTHLKEEFGKGLVCDVDANDIVEYRRKRLAAGVANRTANYETGALRGILRQLGLWGPMADKVMGGNSRTAVLYSVDLTRPMGSWRKAWRIASQVAGVRYRPHDMRHTFISRLAENPGVERADH